MGCPYITKTGDKGKTSIMNQRLAKSSFLIQFLGALDETNSHIGLILHYSSEELKPVFLSIQNQLLNIGGFMSGGDIKIDESYSKWIEDQSAHFYKRLTNVNNFVLPGGSILSSHIHIARCIIRRSETLFWNVGEEKIDTNIAKYINRLSDLLFVLARLHNEEGEHIWKIGEIEYGN